MNEISGAGVHIVGVHGIGQGGTNEIRLAHDWGNALKRGMVRRSGPGAAVPSLTVPHYTGLYRPVAPGVDRHLGLADEEPAGADEPMDVEEEDFVVRALTAYAPGRLPEPHLHQGTLGAPLPYIPNSVIRRLAAADARHGRGAGAKVLVLVRQVYRYLHEEELGERIRKVIRAEIERSGARILLAHSLGSVIAYDMLQRRDLQDPGTHTLITCGSPLGWLTIRRGLPGGAHVSVPEPLHWHNFHADGDPVTGGAGLAHVVTSGSLLDTRVNNGIAAPHDAVRYLSQASVADAVAALTAA
ncbi:hypothetical protein AMK09_19565 [Streptomyces sp. CB02488]|uniref:hypothetical protein n=1 Tax=Streptomyces sp. CB02488 TaxID=1703920 RepID=UPI000966E738|nr:hypothetical protein [Streptomyces sp. CB02488]OKK17907.1 hypothetical protein AMK09_19565 [Streptomyces sp. CB02488]